VLNDGMTVIWVGVVVGKHRPQERACGNLLGAMRRSTKRIGLLRMKEEKEVIVPEELKTEGARMLWEVCKDNGWVDNAWQPTISRSQSALLANYMGEKLNLTYRWKPFETLWRRKAIRSDYNKAILQQQSLEFQDLLKKVFKEVG